MISSEEEIERPLHVKMSDSENNKRASRTRGGKGGSGNDDDDHGAAANNDSAGNLPRSMRLRNRAVAEREASRLARPDRLSASTKLGHASKSKSAVQSTPFGFGMFNKNNQKSKGGDGEGKNDANNETEEWCGPFSVARQMIAKREEAKRKREAEQQKGHDEHHPLDEIVAEVVLDKKRQANPSMQWKGNFRDKSLKSDNFLFGRQQKEQNYYVKRRRRFARQQNGLDDGTGGKVPSLFQLCVDFVVRHFEDVEALGPVDSSIRRAICESLVANGKMNGAAFDAIAEVGIEALELIDCSEVTQDQLSEALEQLIPAGLRALILNHAGRCFGPKAVQAIISSGKANSLFAISIGGAYLFKDSDAASLVAGAASSLSSIEIKACPLIGDEFCSSIGKHFSSSGKGCLLELSLEDLTVSKESLLAIGSSPGALRNLKSLTLKQIESVDDVVVLTLLDSVGNDLEGIDLSNNIGLTDDILSAIRKCNSEGKLRSLQLSALKRLTSAGLEAFFTFDIPGLPRPPALRKMDLSSCDDSAVNDAVMELAVVASSMKKNSELLGVGTGGNLDPLAVSTMGGLVYVNVSGSSITDKTMENLAATCYASLKELDVSFCAHVSDKGLGYLVSKAQNQFAKLHIWGCAQITDEFLDGHSRVEDGGLEILGAWMKKSGARSLR